MKTSGGEGLWACRVAGVCPWWLALNRDELSVRARSGGELAEQARRAEDYAALAARVVAELHTESPRHQAQHVGVGDHRRTERHHQPRERGMVADAR
jgi:hypothetical protein